MKDELRDQIRFALEGYTLPGGYPVFLLTEDGDILCQACVKAKIRLILGALRDGDKHGRLYPAACVVNWEDPALYCDGCGRRIESAYAEDEADA